MREKGREGKRGKGVNEGQQYLGKHIDNHR